MDQSPGDGDAGEALKAFALKVYGTDGVPPACLLLQERFGLDVNVLLFAAFVGAVRGEALAPADLDTVAATVGDWHREVVRPLRAVRQRLKAGPAPAPDAATGLLRGKLQKLEIEAELIELSELGHLAARLGAPVAIGTPEARALAALTMVAAGSAHRPFKIDERAALATIATAAAAAQEGGEPLPPIHHAS